MLIDTYKSYVATGECGVFILQSLSSAPSNTARRVLCQGRVAGVLVRFDDFLAAALVLVTVVCGAFVMALVYADVW